MLRAPVGVEDHSVHLASAGRKGRGKGVTHELGTMVVRDRPADQAPGEQRTYDPKGGGPPTHGTESVFAGPATWGDTHIETAHETRLYGKMHIRA